MNTTPTPSATDDLARTDSYTFYKVGTVLDGKYKGGDLVLVYTDHVNAPCKGSVCGQPIIDRYIKLPDKVIYLQKISFNARPASSTQQNKPANPFSSLGLPMVVDNSSTIPSLEYPENLQESNPSMSLQLVNSNLEEDGTPDAQMIIPVFKDLQFGEIYTTKPGLGPQGSFYRDYGSGFNNKSTVGCRGTVCFATNSFFVFRPDGTYLMFSYAPPFVSKTPTYSAPNIQNVNWNPGVQITSPYGYSTFILCEGNSADALSVIDPVKIKDTDLVAVGNVNSTNDQIYTFRDANNSLLTDFYKTYSDEIKYEQQYDNSQIPKTYNQFVASYPILIWKDPLGRYIRLNNLDFVPSGACEPIIYLYPQHQEKVSLKFGPIVHLYSTTPFYNDGWNIVANPDGTIIDDNTSYPYLFWEGYSTFYPRQDKGFVIKKEEAEEFFQSTLPKLGLNLKETNDFIKAWLPAFHDSPCYFITFYDTQTLNTLVPLSITPKPDTLIRVMMKYSPLNAPQNVTPLQFPPPPARHGFTVVEWGGLSE